MMDDDFDKFTLGEQTTMLKLLVPYVDFKLQMWLAILIRIMEFKLTLDFYKRLDCPFRYQDEFNSNSLYSKLLNICPKEYSSMLQNMNIIMNMSQFSDIFSKTEDIMNAFKSMDTTDLDRENQKEQNPNDLMMNMMNQKQREEYEKYCKMLDE